MPFVRNSPPDPSQRLGSSSRAGRWIAACSAIVVAAVLVGGAVAGPASADVTVPRCVGTTSVATTPGMFVLTGAREAEYEAGDVVVLHSNVGLFDGNGAIPACMVQKVNGAPVSEWAYCTDQVKAPCLRPDDGPLGTIAGNPRFDASVDPLGPDKQRVIAYLATNGYPIRDGLSLGDPGATEANSATSDSRYLVQALIWCVTEAGPGQRTVTGFEGCTRNFDDQDFDAVLARIPRTPSLGVDGPTDDVTVGDDVRFRVSTNVIGTPIALSTDGAGDWRVCGGDATLTGGTLTLGGGPAPAGRTVELCATATAAGAVRVDASVTTEAVADLVWAWNGRTNCQVFATTRGVAPTTLTANGSATVRVPGAPEAPTAPRVPSVPAVPRAPTVKRAASLRITKRSDASTYRPRQRVTFRIRVANPSSRSVRDVRVCDVLPRGLRVVRTSRRSQMRSGQRCWTVRDLGAKRSVGFRIVAQILPGASGSIVNRATVSSPDVVRKTTARRTIRVQRSVAEAGGVTG